MAQHLQYPSGTCCRRYAADVILGLLLLWPLNSWANDSLGRLFTNPVQRSDFEHKRETGYIPPSADSNNNSSNSEANQQQQSSSEQAAESAPPPNTLRINGVVSRNNQPSLLWINDQLIKQPFKHPQAKIGKVNADGGVSLTAEGKSRIQVKTGQQLVLDQGKVIEAYETVEQHGQNQIIRHTR